MDNKKKPQNASPAMAAASLTLLILIYLVCGLRYFPGQPARSLVATLSHLLTFAPFLLGGTIIVSRIFEAFAGVPPPKMIQARVYLTLGLISELFAGIYHYLKYSG